MFLLLNHLEVAIHTSASYYTSCLIGGLGEQNWELCVNHRHALQTSPSFPRQLRGNEALSPCRVSVSRNSGHVYVQIFCRIREHF